MLLSNLIRWGGLAAVLSGVLFIIADLATLVLAAQGNAGGALFRIVVGSVAGVLLLLGLVGLYARRAEVLGVFGLVGFLVAFFGLALAQQNLLWASLLANLGFILFGASCLVAGAYPRAAVIVLVIGALLTGVVNVLIGSGVLTRHPGFAVIVLIVEIIFQASIVSLGISLFTSRSEETQRPPRPSQRSGQLSQEEDDVNEKGETLADVLIVMLCALPFVMFVSPIALLVGQPSPTMTILLWVGMVIPILVSFGAFAWRLWKLPDRS